MKLEKNELVKSTRAAYGEVLQEIGEEFPDVVVMDADLSESTMTCHFAEKYPDRFYNMGIAEQSMMGTAAGLATCGITPICSTFAVFASMRSGEQIRTSICYPKLNVKVVTTHSGLSIGTAGATHFCEEDLAIMRALPNMTVIAPSDFLETKKAVRAALKMDGPVYIRLGRGDAAVLYSELDDYEIGKAITIQDGTDVTLIATGVMVQRAVAAAKLLEQEGVSCRVVDMHTIKPLDTEAVIKAARETKGIVTLEEHNVKGGLGSAVSEVVAELKGEKAPVKILGIPDVFGGVASAELLWDSYGMDAESIAKTAKELMN
ncbi:transketolase family protein [Dysosmobacter sp.]|uniref:transketolase family protein n=1 Tax=Dysosmobacter sp. TaxID=2591382 RepID=UPI003AB27F1C